MRWITRRTFTRAIATAVLAASRPWPARGRSAGAPPSYLEDYADRYAGDPRAAARKWFTEARFGLFVHWNVRANPAGKRRVEHFHADGFDAVALADLAVAAQMRYVNFTVYHGGGPYMWDTTLSNANTQALIGRDLLGELAGACAARRLGLFCYIHVSLIRSHEDRLERNLADARKHRANLLLNTGLRADGSIHPTDAATLREVGRQIRAAGWPDVDPSPGGRRWGLHLDATSRCVDAHGSALLDDTIPCAAH